MMSVTEEYISTGEWSPSDAKETFDLGRQIGAQLRGGEILLLDGPLGAGKTIFVKGLATGLEVDPDEVVLVDAHVDGQKAVVLLVEAGQLLVAGCFGELAVKSV